MPMLMVRGSERALPAVNWVTPTDSEATPEYWAAETDQVWVQLEAVKVMAAAALVDVTVPTHTLRSAMVEEPLV
jgi:hypothetical protein